MDIFASFIKVSHPSPYYWITHGMFSIHLTKLTINVSWFHVSWIQETDYRPHFTCGGLLDFVGHCKHTGRCINLVQLSANGIRTFPKDPQTLHVCAPSWPQRCSSNNCEQLILWIRLVTTSNYFVLANLYTLTFTHALSLLVLSLLVVAW
jgi:hypothetical protein